MESKITNIFKFYSKLFIKLSQLNVSSFLWLIKTKTVITKVWGTNRMSPDECGTRGVHH